MRRPIKKPIKGQRVILYIDDETGEKTKRGRKQIRELGEVQYWKL
jgi:hypothetical protein